MADFARRPWLSKGFSIDLPEEVFVGGEVEKSQRSLAQERFFANLKPRAFSDNNTHESRYALVDQERSG